MATTTTTDHKSIIPPNNNPEWILVTGQPGCGKTTTIKTLIQYLQSHNIQHQGFYTDEVLDPNNPKQRIGFDVVSVPDGKRGVLSRKAGYGCDFSRRYKTGRYFVDVDSFERIALPSLDTTMKAAAPSATLRPTTTITNTVPIEPDTDAVEHNRTVVRKKQKLQHHTTNTTTNTNPTNQNEKIILILDEIGRMELHSTKFQNRVRELLQEDHRLIGAVTAPIYGHRVPFCDEVVATEGVEVFKLTKKNRDGVVEELMDLVREKGWVG